jgi:RNA polymerase sigma-70 factor (ECF subfamily)
MSAGAVEALLVKMRAGDLPAAEQLLLAHEPQLRAIVRRHLSRRLRAKFDSADVVQSVWVRVLRDFRTNGCHIASPEHLRNFLVQVTRNSLTDRLRHYRPALACEQPLTPAAAAGPADGRQPRPSDVVTADETWDRLLAVCPPEHHELLRLKRQRLPLADIAARTGLHEGSIRRIIRQLARKLACPADGLTG